MRRGILSGIWGGITAFCRWCADACVWCVRMAWNACCIGTTLMVGMMGVFFLFALGMFLILVLGGYPLAGLAVVSLGAAVSFFAAAGFVMTLLWRKKRPVLAAAVQADAAEGPPAMKTRRRRQPVRSGKTVKEVQAESEQVSLNRAAESVRTEPAAGAAAAQAEGKTSIPVAEPAVPEETEANGREEEKDHA